MEKQRLRLNNLAITYYNDSLADGAGSQLCRIYGIYAAAREWNIFYYHSPLRRIGYQGVIALEKNEENLELPDLYNKKFHIPSEIEIPSKVKILDVPLATEELLECVREAAEQNPRQFFLMRVASAMSMVSKRPAMLRVVSSFSPFQKKDSSVVRIAIHVRWGDLPIGYSKRLLPNQYYIDVATKIAEVLRKKNIPYVCELYTELSTRPIVVTPRHHGVEGRLKEPMTLDPQIFRIQDFDTIPDLKKFINGGPVETLERLATSDILIMSHSAYSYLAAILNPSGTPVYTPFEYPPMPGWLQAHPHSLFEAQLARIFHPSLLRKPGRLMDAALDSNFDRDSMYSYSPDQNPPSALPHQPSRPPRHESDEISGLEEFCKARVTSNG